MANKKNISLWNMSEGKTKAVITYIEGLTFKVFDANHLKSLEDAKKVALSKGTANEMLRSIGYRNKKTLPRIFSKVVKKK